MKLVEAVEKLGSFFNINIEISEEADSCSTSKDDNTLKITTEDAGGGKYIVLSTKRWAIDSDGINEFCNFLKTVIEQIKEDE